MYGQKCTDYTNNDFLPQIEMIKMKNNLRIRVI